MNEEGTIEMPNGKKMSRAEFEAWADEKDSKDKRAAIFDKFDKKHIDIAMEGEFYDEIWNDHAKERKIRCIICGHVDTHFRMAITMQERNEYRCDKCYQRRIGVRD